MALEAVAAEVRAVLSFARTLFSGAPHIAVPSADITQTVGRIGVQRAAASTQWSGEAAHSYGGNLADAASASERIAAADGNTGRE
jgi:uncharacterized protein YukE